MKERILDALICLAEIMGPVLIGLVICFWIFEFARAIARGVLP